MKTKSISISACLLLTGVLSASADLVPTSTKSFDFESPDFSTGSVIGQQGWSGGATPGLLVEPGNFSTTSESINSTTAVSGTQSWRYDHGITGGYQFGAGTPFTPNLEYSLNTVGDQFYGSLYFKAVTLGDGSYMRLDTGNFAGNDRAEIIGYINNDAGNLSFTLLTLNPTRDNYLDIVVADHLDDGWHRLDFNVTRTGAEQNTVTAWIDGGASQSEIGSLGDYRLDDAIPYEASSRLKFAASKSGNGFYFDDITYSTTAVPEPSTYLTLAGNLIILGGVMMRRRLANGRQVLK